MTGDAWAAWSSNGWIQGATILLGLLLGSFLNVVRTRLPEGESLWGPRSRCPACRTTIRAVDNVPVLSYLLLKGRCRACGKGISWRYPAVEILGALVLLMTLRMSPGPQEAAFSAVFSLSLVAVLFIDLDWQIIPDLITLPGTVLGILAGLWLDGGILPRLLGSCAGGLGLLALIRGYKLATGIEGMGMGDVKLMAMVGAFLGWQGAVAVLLLGSLSGSLVGLALLALGRAKRQTALPFGTFLAPAAWVVLFWGRDLWESYRGLWTTLGG
jgi:leader peptidase (prepilin peptidase)/N-methyltransferase